MEVTRIRALRGPNLWSRHTSIEAIVRCAPDELSIDRISRFEVRLRARFPLIGAIRPIGSRDDIPIAQALQFAALRLQAQAGCPVTFSRTAPTREPGLYQVVVEYTEEPVGRLALQLAEALCLAARDDQPSTSMPPSTSCAHSTRISGWAPAPGRLPTRRAPATSPSAA
jgi:cyanophycin synthetase